MFIVPLFRALTDEGGVAGLVDLESGFIGVLAVADEATGVVEQGLVVLHKGVAWGAT